jgi:hypothetical protein
MNDTVIKSKVGEVDESWDCSSCPWWHKPAVGRTGMNRVTSLEPAVVIGIIIILGLMVVFAGIIFSEKAEYTTNSFSSNGKCYEMKVRVGWAEGQTVKEVPCSGSEKHE